MPQSPGVVKSYRYLVVAAAIVGFNPLRFLAAILIHVPGYSPAISDARTLRVPVNARRPCIVT